MNFALFSRVLGVIALVWCFSIAADSSVDPELKPTDSQLKLVFEHRLKYLISQLNIERNKPSEQQNLSRLAQQEIVSRWDIRATLLGLVGRTLWQQMEIEHRQQLERAFRETLLRYFLEAYGFYSGQPIVLQEVKLNRKGTKGWLKLVVELDYLPDFQIDVGILHSPGEWLYRDIRIQGISYINLKRRYYQGTITDKGVRYLIDELSVKNKNFFAKYSQVAVTE